VRRRLRGHDDRGSAAAELIVLITVAFTFVAVIVFVGRMNVGSAHTEAAARAAARTISLARDPASARQAAHEQASRIVEEGSPICTDMAYDAQIGPAEVTVTVACTVDLSQMTQIALVPGSRQVRADATESIDPYREAP
jgi:Flp pilus assembly protein TadG